MKTTHTKFLSIFALTFFCAFFSQAQSPGGINLEVDGRSLDLWVDGNNSTATSWPNLVPAAFSLEGGSRRPTVRNSRFNFHRELFFGGHRNVKIATTANYRILSGRAYSAFVVSENLENGERVLLSYNPTTSDANARRTSLQWDGTNIRVGWNATMVALNPANTQRYGIASMNVMNSAGGAGTVFMNGRGTNFTASSQTVTGSQLFIGNGSNNMTSGLSAGRNLEFGGTMQEIIVMSGNTRLSDVDIQRIHSYLAIKYGLTLENNANFLNSDATIIWNGVTNFGFNNHIFGIGRDDATRLNQVQSRSSSSNMLTLFKGSSIQTLNDNNSTLFSDDKTHLIIGSNGRSIYADADVDYEYIVGNDKINYRTDLIYRAQLTTAGIQGGTQTVNIRIESRRPRFVFVSANSAFPLDGTTTRVYPITNRTASIEINDGDYITFGGFEASPGGVSGYTLSLWIDGNNSTNYSWENLAFATHSLERFAPHTPIVRNSRFNFHREIFFNNQASSRLRTTANHPLNPGESYQIFIVSESPNNANGVMFSFGGDGGAASLRWQSAANNILRANWRTADRNTNFTGSRFGILTMNIDNVDNSPVNHIFLNGRLSTALNSSSTFSLGTSSSARAADYNERLIIGGANTSTSSTSTSSSNAPFNGTIQEMIVMRRPTRGLMPADDIQRVHSYLAVKYGIHLETGNYIASDGKAVVWERILNPDYNNHIFGIGRDDNTGLYQKQARSASSRYLTIFIGNAPMPALNSQNTGVLDDMQYLMIGTNSDEPIKQLRPIIENGTRYKNDVLVTSEAFNIKSPVYMAQLTEMTSIKINATTSRDFLYAFVSNDDTFTPENTYIYPISGDVFEINLDKKYRYFKFVGFAPGPGGITTGLTMWLRADDVTGVKTIGLTVGDEGIRGLSSRFIDDPNNVPGVEAWSDLARGHTYSLAASGATRHPVLNPNDPEMNFQSGVRFWAVGSYADDNTDGHAAFLGNASPIMNGSPEHTTIIVLNHRFETTAPVTNILFFGGASGQGYDAPGYALATERRTVTAVAQGRFRWGDSRNDIEEGNQDLFTAGAVSILGYYVAPSSGQMYFRFNGVEESKSFNSNEHSINFARGSQLGRGRGHGRSVRGLISEVIIYNKLLHSDEKRKVESYLALKYGVTLRPSAIWNNGPLRDINPNLTGRFNYTFSSGKLIWEGQTGAQEDIDFYNNIAAVIRDDVARLYNRQAHSTDAGSIMQLGLAGTKLTDNGEFLGFFDNDMEAVIWGSTDMNWERTQFGGAISEMREDDCGDFEYIFNRIWRVQKVLQDNRPIQMLVAARNNSETTFGENSDSHTLDYYGELHSGNDFFMLVADSKEDMINRNFRRVVPMNFIVDKHQTSFKFTDSISYITFGFRTNTSGCMSNPDAEFEGSKRFDWTQWTSRTNTNRNTTQNVNLVVPGGEFGDLGNNIEVIRTSVSYAPGVFSSTGVGVRAYRGFPRSVNSPERGSLEVQRRGGQPNLDSDVVIRIEFNNPVIPEFTIAGLSGDRRAREEVEIVGWCNNSATRFSPVLSYVDSPNTATYDIQDNGATVNRRVSAAANNRNGQVRVEFQGGVNVVEIRYRITGRRSTSRQQIFISPLILRPVMPPPPINEDGLGFVKQIRQANVFTCDLVEYTFFIHNTNCEPKFVSFTDTLQSEFMNWYAGSLGLDTINALHNPSIRINEYGGSQIIKIDSMILPPASVIRLTLAAAFSEDAPTGIYQNRASISYDRAGGTVIFPSFDRETLEAVTSCFAEQVIPKNPVQMKVTATPSRYKANDIIEVTISFTNPNDDDITDSFLNIDFNEEFTLVPGSLKITDAEENDISENFKFVGPEASDEDKSFFSIVGVCFFENGVILSEECTGDEPEGFALSTGEIVITFQLQAPAEPADELNNAGVLTGNKLPLEIIYNFSSGMDIPCMGNVMPAGEGVRIVPFAAKPQRIMTNRHIITRNRR